MSNSSFLINNYQRNSICCSFWQLIKESVHWEIPWRLLATHLTQIAHYRANRVLERYTPYVNNPNKCLDLENLALEYCSDLGLCSDFVLTTVSVDSFTFLAFSCLECVFTDKLWSYVGLYSELSNRYVNIYTGKGCVYSEFSYTAASVNFLYSILRLCKLKSGPLWLPDFSKVEVSEMSNPDDATVFLGWEYKRAKLAILSRGEDGILSVPYQSQWH